MSTEVHGRPQADIRSDPRHPHHRGLVAVRTVIGRKRHSAHVCHAVALQPRKVAQSAHAYEHRNR